VELQAKARRGKIRRVKACLSLFMIYLHFDLVFWRVSYEKLWVAFRVPSKLPLTIIYCESKGVFWGTLGRKNMELGV